MNSVTSSLTWKGLMHLLIVYFVWGSTYLAIRIGVQEGSGFPPFSMGASRLLLASLLLLLGGLCLKKRLNLTRKEALVLFASGILLWTGGNGLILWAEQDTSSGYAALFAGSTPIWTALIDALTKKKLPSWQLLFFLFLAFAGICCLSLPVLLGNGSASLSGILVLISAPICWGLGSVLQERNPLALDPLVSSGYQQVSGALGFLVLALLFHEPWPHPTSAAWWSWWYLVVFGSLVAFTSFVIILKTLPINIAMTYSYVNPVVAVILGWLVLREPITLWTIIGSILILLGVGGVFSQKYGEKSK